MCQTRVDLSPSSSLSIKGHRPPWLASALHSAYWVHRAHSSALHSAYWVHRAHSSALHSPYGVHRAHSSALHSPYGVHRAHTISLRRGSGEKCDWDLLTTCSWCHVFQHMLFLCPSSSWTLHLRRFWGNGRCHSTATVMVFQRSYASRELSNLLENSGFERRLSFSIE